MNIFATDMCPIKSAQCLDDKRVNKMIIESIQMLAYAISKNYKMEDMKELLPKTNAGNPYKIDGSHKNHPCSIWCGKSRANFVWLLRHAIALIREKEKRYPKGKSTKNYREALLKCFAARGYMKDSGKIIKFTNSSRYKFLLNTEAAYKLTMMYKWLNSTKFAAKEEKYNSSPRWSNADRPRWFNH